MAQNLHLEISDPVPINVALQIRIHTVDDGDQLVPAARRDTLSSIEVKILNSQDDMFPVIAAEICNCADELIPAAK